MASSTIDGRTRMRGAARAALTALLVTTPPLAGCTRDPIGGEQPAMAATTSGKVGQTEITPRQAIPQAAEAISDAFANAAQGIRPSVVRIDVEIGTAAGGGMAQHHGENGENGLGDVPEFLRRFFEFGDGGGRAPGPVRGTGSGVFVDSAGHVITNAHVVANADKVTITLVDGRKFPGKVLGKDPHTDIGVVQFAKDPGTLTIARVGNSDLLRVGQWVLAVGSPLGMDQSVTAGIVSGLGSPHSHMRVSERARGYIQTDASINPGNSGGPLVNLAGEVVGINTMINVGPGGAYGFAIPVAQVSQVSQTLIKEGRVRYPYLGVNIGDLDDLSDEAKAKLSQSAGKLPDKGAVVGNLVAGGPAAEAGLQPGDVITKIGDRKVESAADVVDYVTSQKIGAKVKLEYQRQGKTQSATVTLRELPGEAGGEAGPLGLSLQTLTPPLAESLGLPHGTKGAVVADLAEGSPAARAGLRPGDVIVEVDRKAVTSAEAADKALAGGKSHLLRVVGPGGARFVTVGK
jgi:serine protease Do